MYLELENATNSIINEDILNRLRNYQNVIIFGAGDSGSWAADLLRQHNVFPQCYCDNSPRKWGKLKNGLRIRSFEDVMKEYKDVAVCIASMWQEEIYNQICEYDSSLSNHVYDVLTTMAWETSERLFKSSEREYIKKNENAFANLYQELADEYSKRTLEGILNYRLTRDKQYLKSIKSEETTYLDSTILSADLMQTIAENIIIDGGAFDGDTVEMFVQTIGNRNALDIHCYEAEVQNYEIIEDKIQNRKWKSHQIFVHKAALWDRKGKIGFGGDGLSGRADQNADIQISTERIDDYPYKRVGLIKLDIEGAERNALWGAADTIKKYKPVLAICAYHLQDDLLVLSDFVKSLNCGYKLILRHYMLSAGDTILYGIPSYAET